MIDDKKCNDMYDELDKVLELLTAKYHPNYFELIHVVYMMDSKLKQSNIEQYFMETVENFSKFIDATKKKDSELV